MINVGIIGCGFVGGVLKDWLEHNNAFAKIIEDTPLGTLLEHLHEMNVHFLG